MRNQIKSNLRHLKPSQNVMRQECLIFTDYYNLSIKYQSTF